MRISAPSSSVQSTRSGIEHDHVADGLDVAGGDGAGALLLHHHALGAFALHLDGDVLDVEHDVGDVLAHAGDRGELVQHAVDVHRLHRRALQRGEQNAAQRIAQRHAEAALERLGDDGRDARGVVAGGDLELVRPDQFLPILLDHVFTFSSGAGAIASREPHPPCGESWAAADASRHASASTKQITRDDAYAAGNRCAGSWSRRGSR